MVRVRFCPACGRKLTRAMEGDLQTAFAALMRDAKCSGCDESSVLCTCGPKREPSTIIPGGSVQTIFITPKPPEPEIRVVPVWGERWLRR